jgi:hypothetical protein
LLRKLYTNDDSVENFPINQEILMNSKLLLIPIKTSVFIEMNIHCIKETCIDDLEMDLVIKLRDLFKMKEKNTKIKVALSGRYFIES